MSVELGGLNGNNGINDWMSNKTSTEKKGKTVSQAEENDDSLSLKKAIKAYRDEILTGLTEDEKKEIEQRAKAYLEKYPVKTKQERESFNEYVKSLLKKFGFKGNVDDYAVTMAGEILDNLQNSNEQPAKLDVKEQFQRSAMGFGAVNALSFNFLGSTEKKTEI